MSRAEATSDLAAVLAVLLALRTQAMPLLAVAEHPNETWDDPEAIDMIKRCKPICQKILMGLDMAEEGLASLVREVQESITTSS